MYFSDIEPFCHLYLSDFCKELRFSFLHFFFYRSSYIEIPSNIVIREVYFKLSGTISGLKTLTVENKGYFLMTSDANTANEPIGTLHVTNISARAGSQIDFLKTENGSWITVNLTNIVVNSKGNVRTNNLLLYAVNVTVDLSGK